jgi:hypothetical protein
MDLFIALGILLILGLVIGHRTGFLRAPDNYPPADEPGDAWRNSLSTPESEIRAYDMAVRAPGALGVDATFDELLDEQTARELEAQGKECWLQTTPGKSFSYLRPKVEEVDLFDVAQTVSRLPRFLGRTQGASYFVGQHLVLTALLLWQRFRIPAVALHGLSHDLHEAYTGDLPTPLKWALGSGVDRRVKVLQAKIDVVLFDALGLGVTIVPDSRKLVAAADADMLIWERDNFVGKPAKPWFLDGKTELLTHESFGLPEDSPLLNPLSSELVMVALTYLMVEWSQAAADLPGLLFDSHPSCSDEKCRHCATVDRIIADIDTALSAQG